MKPKMKPRILGLILGRNVAGPESPSSDSPPPHLQAGGGGAFSRTTQNGRATGLLCAGVSNYWIVWCDRVCGYLNHSHGSRSPQPCVDLRIDLLGFDSAIKSCQTYHDWCTFQSGSSIKKNRKADRRMPNPRICNMKTIYQKQHEKTQAEGLSSTDQIDMPHRYMHLKVQPLL